MTDRDGDVSMFHFRRRHEASSAPFGIVLAVSLLLQFSGSAEDVASFGQNSVTQEATQNSKRPIAQTENAGEHQNWAIHFDAVEVFQGQPGFHSPYRGAQSLFSDDNFRQTTEADLFFAARVWPGGEIYFNPEYYQGFGFGATHGLAAFSNSMAYKTGQFRGDFNIPHIFFRQVFGFGGEQEQLDADELQLAGKVDISRLTVQIGRFSVVDVFDNNAFAHDPRGDFLNWAAVDALAFDYAADALGYEEGLYLELNQKAWAARWGIFTIPHIPNVNGTDGQYLRAWQQVAELEGRYTLCDHPGKVRLLGYLESARMGSYKAAVVNFPTGMPDIAATRRYRYTYGLELNIEQEITKDLGGFLRLAMRDPNYEVYQFSDVSRSLEIGLSLKGTCWNRPNDTVGLAEMLGGLSHAQKRFFNDGGLGILIGDGKLPHYGPENVIEAYYNCELFKGINFTLDYQLAADPAYNKDRGPINIFSARLRVKF
jgi:high affinity Mn2+ porin